MLICVLVPKSAMRVAMGTLLNIPCQVWASSDFTCPEGGCHPVHTKSFNTCSGKPALRNKQVSCSGEWSLSTLYLKFVLDQRCVFAPPPKKPKQTKNQIPWIPPVTVAEWNHFQINPVSLLKFGCLWYLSQMWAVSILTTAWTPWQAQREL